MGQHTDHIDEELDAYLDGELPYGERRKVAKHLRGCKVCREKYQEQLSISSQLRNLPIQACPNSLIEKVMQKTRPSQHSRRWWHISGLLGGSAIRWRVATGFAVAAALALLLMLWPTGPDEPFHRNQYSPAQVARARSDVVQAVGYLAGVLNGTRQKIKEEILLKQVVKPVARGLHTAFRPLGNDGG